MKKGFITFLFSIVLATSVLVQSKPATKVKSSSSNVAASIARGKVLYTTHCLTCHQADGGGVPNMNPPLIKTSYVLGDKNRLTGIVLNGWSERVDIDGDTYTNNMPAHNFLSDQQIADVLTYVRNSFGNKASQVTVAEVKRARANVKK